MWVMQRASMLQCCHGLATASHLHGRTDNSCGKRESMSLCMRIWPSWGTWHASVTAVASQLAHDQLHMQTHISRTETLSGWEPACSKSAFRIMGPLALSLPSHSLVTRQYVQSTRVPCRKLNQGHEAR